MYSPHISKKKYHWTVCFAFPRRVQTTLQCNIELSYSNLLLHEISININSSRTKINQFSLTSENQRKPLLFPEFVNILE